MAASIVALLFVCVGMVGLALVPGHLPGDAGGTHVAHAAGCSGSAVSSPSSGPVGAVIAVCGSGWSSIADGTHVSFGYSTNSNCASNNTIVQNGQMGTMQGGSYSGWFRWPTNTSLETYTVCAFIANIAAPPANPYTVLSTSPPQLMITPTQIHPGQTVTVSGSNFLPGGTFVSLAIQPANGGTSQSLGSTVSNSNGSFSISKTIPGNSLGSDTVVANAGAGQQPTLSASVTFTVNNLPTPTPGQTPTVVVPVGMTPTAVATPTATATAITATPTSASGATPVSTQQNTVPGQTPTAGNPSNNAQNGQNGTGTNTGNAGSGKGTPSPLPFALGAVVVLFLLTVLLSFVRTRNKRKRAAELEKELAPHNGPPLEGANGLIASYMNNSMNPGPISPMPINAGQPQMMPVNVSDAASPTAVMSNAAMQGQTMQAPQSIPGSSANGGAMHAQTSAGVGMGVEAPGLDALLEAKMRQAQMGLYAVARTRTGSEEGPRS